MVREAFALLRQSIIHVEKDDIDFEDSDNDDDGGAPPANGMDVDEEGDEAAMLAQEIAAAEAAESSYAAGGGSSGVAAPAQLPTAPAKKKLKITYDRYMSIMNLGEINIRPSMCLFVTLRSLASASIAYIKLESEF